MQALLEQDKIMTRIQELGAQISQDYAGESILMVGVLKGVVPFFTHLIQAIEGDVEIDFICASSYHDKTYSSGEVKMVLDLARPIENRHVMLVEDIVDTGRTFLYLHEQFTLRQPKTLKLASLLSKPGKMETKIDIDYLGFEIGDEFVVGFGLDYAEKYRHLPYVAVLPPSLIQD